MKKGTLKGIRKTATSWQVYARVRGRFVSKRFPLDTTEAVLREERERLIAETKFGIVVPGQTPSTAEPPFERDAEDYLALVTYMPSYRDRAYRIRQWASIFRGRPRSTITARDIAAVLEHWRKGGASDGGPLSPASLNQRRTALMHLYTKLDGRSAANIVKDVAPYDERDSEQMRALPMVVCARLVRRLRYWGKMRARLHVLMWTGWPHALLKELQPADIDWANRRVRLSRRRKGRGMPSIWVPLVPRAWWALRRFDALGAYGWFSNSSLHSAVARAVAAENRWRAAQRLEPLTDVRPYSFRHSFATWAGAILHDDRALKALLRTNSIHRYSLGATDARLTEAIERLSLLPRKVPRPQQPKESGEK